MNLAQCDALIECQKTLINSLTTLQYHRWMTYCETCTDGDLVDGLVELMHFIETNELPSKE